MNIGLTVPGFTACCVLALAAGCADDDHDVEGAAMAVDERPDIVATNAFYYYRDVDAAAAFYRDRLGFETVVDYGFAAIFRLAEASYLTVVQADEGMHSADEPKVVTLHFVTDELTRWRDHFIEHGVPLEDAESSFDLRDTEGYRLRFVRYNPHPEHAGHVAAFAAAEPLQSRIDTAGRMSVRATAFSVFYPDVDAVRPFFEGLFDVRPAGMLDEVPLYRLSKSGFVALESLDGPAPAAPGENGMTLSFFTGDVDAWFARASRWPGFELRTGEILNEGGRVRVFVGYDPAGLFLEWDTFLDVAENEALTGYLR